MKKIKRIDLANQWKIQEKKILPKILKVLSSGNYILDTNVKKLEEKLAKFCNRKFCITTNSGTDALTLGLHLCGIKKGDEVITQSNSFVASTASIVHIGAKPIFADVNEDGQINVHEIKKKITKKTKAILVAHLYGKMTDMDELLNLSKKNNLKIIEDCAQAIGSKYNGRISGSWGDVGCFSTHPLKNLNACGDGGFIVTNNLAIYKKGKSLINHGHEERNVVKNFGYVSRMDEIQAAILLERLKILEDIIKIRRNNAKIYFKNLNLKNIKYFEDTKKQYSTYHLFIINSDYRDELIKYLMKKKIETSIHYPTPIHMQKAFIKKFKRIKDLKMTELLSKKILSLPINEFIKEKEIIKISNEINKFYDKKLHKKSKRI